MSQSFQSHSENAAHLRDAESHRLVQVRLSHVVSNQSGPHPYKGDDMYIRLISRARSRPALYEKSYEITVVNQCFVNTI